MKTLTNEQILEEVKKRNLYQEILEDLDNNDITNEVERRGLEGQFKEDEDKLYEEFEKSFKHNNFVLSKDFDRFKLREHLVDIAGLQSHVSDKTLLAKIEELLEYS